MNRRTCLGLSAAVAMAAGIAACILNPQPLPPDTAGDSGATFGGGGHNPGSGGNGGGGGTSSPGDSGKADLDAETALDGDGSSDGSWPVVDGSPSDAPLDTGSEASFDAPSDAPTSDGEGGSTVTADK